MDITLEVGNRIRYYRTMNKISQEKLSELSGVHPSYIGQLERGEKTPSIETLFKICQGLGISMSSLMKDIDDLAEITQNESYALKAYWLMEKQSLGNQEHLFRILEEAVKIK